MKSKEFGRPGGGVRPSRPPLDPPMPTIGRSGGGGAWDARLPWRSKFLHFHAVFGKKNWKIIALLGVGAPSSGKSWIRHCRLLCGMYRFLNFLILELPVSDYPMEISRFLNFLYRVWLLCGIQCFFNFLFQNTMWRSACWGKVSQTSWSKPSRRKAPPPCGTSHSYSTFLVTWSNTTRWSSW